MQPVNGNVDGTARCDIGAFEFNGAVITSLSPATGKVGANPFMLTVKGTRFTENSKIRWKGQARPTTFVDSTTFKTTTGTADVPAPGAVTVQVITAGSGTDGNAGRRCLALQS